MLAANQVDVVVPLVIVGSDVRGTVARVADRGVAREGHHRQSVGQGIADKIHAGNVEVGGGGKVQSRIPVFGVDKEASPAVARRVDDAR